MCIAHSTIASARRAMFAIRMVMEAKTRNLMPLGDRSVVVTPSSLTRCGHRRRSQIPIRLRTERPTKEQLYEH